MTGTRVFLRGALLALLPALLFGTGCFGKKKTVADVGAISAGDNFNRAMKLLADRELRQATGALSRIRFNPETKDVIEPLTRLAIADATFYQSTPIGWIDARSKYVDFVTLNANHPLAPYAQLQVGACSLKQVNAPAKDQTMTRQAIRDFEQVVERWPTSLYVDAARGLLRQARGRLAESEYLVGRFYLKKKAYIAAIDRFRNVVEGFPDYPELEKVLFRLGQAHLRTGNTLEGRVFMDRLIHDYPRSKLVGQAQKALRSIGDDFETELSSTN
jgi:outer membrane protein assembly factor BamD